MANQEPLSIVRLDALHSPDPTFTIPHKYTAHHNTPHDKDVIISRLQDADVAITTLSESLHDQFREGGRNSISLYVICKVALFSLWPG